MLARPAYLARHPRILIGVGLILAIALSSSLTPAQTHASFISVSVTFTNIGKLPLKRQAIQLDHGCWNPEPPLSIEPFATVTWESDSCGLATGTEGSVDYRPFGAPIGVVGHFYWDDPFIGTNTATDSAPSGCTSSHSGPGGGDNVSVFYTMGCVDSSQDGIADVWKLNGATFDDGSGPQFVDLAAMGATVGQKDIFLQLDWMQDATHNQQLTANAIKRLVTAFGANGYVLHVDAGPSSIMNFSTNATWGGLSRAKSTPYQASLGTTTVDASGNVTNYDWTAYNTIKAANFTPTGRAAMFHYVLAARQLGSVTNSGISQSPGTDIIISLGGFTGGVGSETEQLGTIMHELGHNLNLGHGGGSSVNYKPNYFSVMNYAFQFSGITKNGVTTYDYSHEVDSQLVEASLSEAVGVPGAAGFVTVHYCPAAGGNPATWLTVPVAAGRIDWNCDGVADVNNVSADINGDPAQPANTEGTLTGYNDWQNLKLTVGSIGAFGAGVPAPPIRTIIDDPTPQMVQQILPIDTTAPQTTAVASPPANGAGWNKSDVTVTLTATDAGSGVARTEFNIDGGGWTKYTVPVVISTEATHAFQYRSIDRASNTETAKSLTVKLDKTAPAITITTPADGGAYIVKQVVLADYTCSDSLSGLVPGSCSGPVATGTAIDTAAVGTKTFTVTAADVADNTGSKTASYAVTFKICPLYDQTKVQNGGNTVPIKLQICDANNTNVSGPAITLHATSVTGGSLDDSGTANPGLNFRYDPTLDPSGGYVFNLSSKGLATGPQTLSFTATGDPTVHTVQFVLR